ncbi:hypothetical protein BaRGS_00035003, partial [Batillaria attramentaria]
DDTAPTSSGGSVAGVVIALLLIGVVIVVVVYRHRTKKTGGHVWRFFITANRAGARQVTNDHDDRPSGDDNDVVVMIDNVAYGGATAMFTKPQPADYEEDAVLKNARKKVPVKEDKEEMVMIDNIVYEGGKPLPKTAQVAENDYEDIKCLQQPPLTSISADTDHQGDDDEEVVMIDNVAYEGTRLQKDNYQHIRAPQRSPKGSQANNGSVNHDRTSKDDEVVMIDNILYEGGNAATRGSTAKPTTHDATKPATDGGVDDSSQSGEYGVCTAGVSPRSTQNASETPESTQTVSTSPDLSLKLEVGIIIIVLGGVTILGLFATVITTIVVCGKRRRNKHAYVSQLRDNASRDDELESQNRRDIPSVHFYWEIPDVTPPPNQ